jgi:hypothetical protein
VYNNDPEGFTEARMGTEIPNRSIAYRSGTYFEPTDWIHLEEPVVGFVSTVIILWVSQKRGMEQTLRSEV